MKNEPNKSIINKIDINTEEETEFISPINDLSFLIINFFKSSIENNEKLINSIKSLQNDLFLVKSIPDNISNKINKHNSELINKINSYDFELRLFFEKVKNLYKIMTEKKQLFSKITNYNYTIKLDYNKLNKLSQEILKVKEYNEKLIKKIGAKNLIINQLELDILQLKEDKDISNLKQKIEELNEEIKKISFENEQQKIVLEKNGIEIVGGEAINTTKEDILEGYQNENENLKKKIKILEEMSDFSNQNKNLIQSDIYIENIDLKNKIEKKGNEINLLKINNEQLLKNSSELKTQLEKKEEEINSLKIKNEALLKENDFINCKYKELLNNNSSNIINNINNININNKINFDDVINRFIIFIKENEKLKNKNKKLKNEIKILSELDLKSIKRSYFESLPELKKMTEEDYNKEKLSALGKNIDSLQDINLDYPNISNIIENYRKIEYNNKEMNKIINNAKSLLKKEINDKNLRIELSKILGLENN